MRTLSLSVALILFAPPASAIDCGLATSASEKAICSDPEARSADEALSKAYGRLRSSLSGNDAAELRRSQTEWIQSRDAACAAPDAIKPLSECLAVQSRERQGFLDGKPHAGDLSESLFRRISVSRPAKNGSAKLSIRAIKFIGGDAWQSSVNAKIDAAVKRAISDAEAAKDNPGSHDGYSVDLGVDLTYASSRMVSLRVDVGSYVGQAHEDWGSYNINFDRTTNRELKFEDLFDGASAKPVFEFCRSEVAKQKRARSDDADHWKDDVELKEVSEDTKDLSFWGFKASSVDVDYGAYAFGGYGQCMCTCTIPYAMLRPIAKKEFPLP
jgi:uncharacterized protein YecT (DUF1311 family)